MNLLCLFLFCTKLSLATLFQDAASTLGKQDVCMDFSSDNLIESGRWSVFKNVSSVTAHLIYQAKKLYLPCILGVSIIGAPEIDIKTFTVPVSEEFVLEYIRISDGSAYVRKDCLLWYNEKKNSTWESKLIADDEKKALPFSPFTANILAKRQVAWDVLSMVMHPSIKKIFEHFMVRPPTHDTDPSRYSTERIGLPGVLRSIIKTSEAKTLLSNTPLSKESYLSLLIDEFKCHYDIHDFLCAFFEIPSTGYVRDNKFLKLLPTLLQTGTSPHEYHAYDSDLFNHNESHTSYEAGRDIKNGDVIHSVLGCKEQKFPAEFKAFRNTFKLLEKFPFANGEHLLGVYVCLPWVNDVLLSGSDEKTKEEFWATKPAFTRPPLIDEDFNQLHDEVEERNYFTQQLPNMRLAWHTKFEDKIRMEQKEREQKEREQKEQEREREREEREQQEREEREQQEREEREQERRELEQKEQKRELELKEQELKELKQERKELERELKELEREERERKEQEREREEQEREREEKVTFVAPIQTSIKPKAKVENDPHQSTSQSTVITQSVQPIESTALNKQTQNEDARDGQQNSNSRNESVSKNSGENQSSNKDTKINPAKNRWSFSIYVIILIAIIIVTLIACIIVGILLSLRRGIEAQKDSEETSQEHS